MKLVHLGHSPAPQRNSRAGAGVSSAGLSGLSGLNGIFRPECSVGNSPNHAEQLRHEEGPSHSPLWLQTGLCQDRLRRRGSPGRGLFLFGKETAPS